MWRDDEPRDALRKFEIHVGEAVREGDHIHVVSVCEHDHPDAIVDEPTEVGGEPGETAAVPHDVPTVLPGLDMPPNRYGYVLPSASPTGAHIRLRDASVRILSV